MMDFESAIDHIKAVVPIESVIRESVSLKRRGSALVGRCPFHDEKTPSFNVNSRQGYYKCFGCGAAGDIFTFMEKYHRLKFIEAAEELARRAGFELPRSKQSNDRHARVEKLLPTVQRIAQHYSRTLASEEGAPARAFLTELSLTPAMCEQLGIGLAPSDSRWLTEFEGSIDELDALDIVCAGDDGQPQDRFASCITFTLTSMRGDVVGFCGVTRDRQTRTWPPSAGRSWICTSRSPAFVECREMYGLHAVLAQRPRAERVVVATNPLEAAILSATGESGYAAAPCLGIMTTAQARELFRRFDHVALCVAGDPQQREALTRLEHLLEFASGPKRARVCVLPGDHTVEAALRDPERGASWITERIQNAPLTGRFIADYLLNNSEGASDDERTQMAAATLRAISDTLYLNPLIRQLTDEGQINESGLRHRCLEARARFVQERTRVEQAEEEHFAPSTESFEDDEGIPDIQPDPLYSLMDDVQGIYRALLLSERGAEARAYLQRRGLVESDYERFDLGLALGRTTLLGSLADRRDDLRALGLISDSEGDAVDMLRDRLTFAIRAENGRIVAFAGRTLDNHPAKYLNTRDSDYFHKSEVLYGLPAARLTGAKPRQVIVVEGYMDVISLIKAGVDVGVVAPMGTSLTEAHARRLCELFSIVVLFLDGDDAGQAATARSMKQLLPWAKETTALRVVDASDGLDPDDAIRQRGADQVKKDIQMAFGVAQFLVDYAQQQAQGRADALMKDPDALSQLAETVACARNQWWRRALMKDVCDLTGIAHRELLESITRTSPPPASTHAIAPDPQVTTLFDRSMREYACQVLMWLRHFPALLDETRFPEIRWARDAPFLPLLRAVQLIVDAMHRKGYNYWAALALLRHDFPALGTWLGDEMDGRPSDPHLEDRSIEDARSGLRHVEHKIRCELDQGYFDALSLASSGSGDGKLTEQQMHWLKLTQLKRSISRHASSAGP